MQSIGIWYKSNKKEGVALVDFHINLWNLYERKELKPFVDFGITIDGFRSIDKLKILMPFHIEKDDIFDLFDYVKLPEIARLIFNEEDCEIESVGQYFSIKMFGDQKPGDQKLLIKAKEDYIFSKIEERSIGNNRFTILEYDLKKICENGKLKNYDKVYFRFRIRSAEIEKALYCPIDKPNWFLESGFIKTQIIDIKLNKERNLPFEICQDMRMNNYSFVDFNKIHLLVMCRSNDNVESFNNSDGDCRKLETEGWNTYLDDRNDIDNVLAYHWKEKRSSGTNEKLKDYGKLIKISSATTNYVMILVYMSVVIALGTIGSILASLILR